MFSHAQLKIDLCHYREGIRSLGMDALTTSEPQAIDATKAINLFRKLQAGSLRSLAYAQYNFRLKNYTQALTNLKAVKQDDSVNMADVNFIYGRCYAALNHIHLAIEYYLQAANADHLLAHLFMGKLLQDVGNYKLAAECFKRISRIIPEASFRYYLLCADEKVANQDMASAHVYFMRAKDANYPLALDTHANYCEGRQNYSEAITAYEKASLQGYVPSTVKLAKLYASVDEVKSLEASRKYYELAAHQGDPCSAMYVANSYWLGLHGFPQDGKKTDIFYALAIEQFKVLLADPHKTSAYADYYYRLGVIYSTECKHNVPKALKFAALAKKLHHPQVNNLIKELKAKIEKGMEMIYTEDEADIAPEAETTEQPAEDLIELAHNLQQNKKFKEAINQWKIIINQDRTPIMRIKYLYATAFCYASWSDYPPAPVRSLDIAKNRLQKALNMIAKLIINQSLLSSELDELETWRDFIFAASKRYKIILNNDSATIPVETVEHTPAPSIDTPKSKPAAARPKANPKFLPFKIELTKATEFIYHRLKAHGYNLLIVGGTVRDAFNNKPSKDIDLISNCDFEKLLELFSGYANKIGNAHPIIVIEYADERIEISYYKYLYADYLARDITINACYYDPSSARIIYFGDALRHLKEKILQAINLETFAQDPIRLLRAIELSSRLGLVIDPLTKATMSLDKNRAAFKSVNPDLLINKLLSLFVNPSNVQAIHLLNKFNFLEFFFPYSTPALIDVRDPYYSILERFLRSAGSTTSDNQIDAALLFAILLFPQLNKSIAAKIITINHINSVIDQTLKLQSQQVVLSQHSRTRIKQIWLTFFKLDKKLFNDEDEITYATYIAASSLFQFVKGQEFQASPTQTRNFVFQESKILTEFETAIVSRNLNKVETLLRKHGLPMRLKYNGATALHLAASTGNCAILNAILAQRPSLNLLDRNLQSALHYASANGKVDAVKILLAVGMDFRRKDINGETALHFAAARGHSLVVNYLLLTKPALLNIENNLAQTALAKAWFANHVAVTTLLLNAGAEIRDLIIPEKVLKSCHPNKLVGITDAERLKLLDHFQSNLHNLPENDSTSYVALLPSAAWSTVQRFLFFNGDNNNQSKPEIGYNQPSV